MWFEGLFLALPGRLLKGCLCQLTQKSHLRGDTNKKETNTIDNMNNNEYSFTNNYSISFLPQREEQPTDAQMDFKDIQALTSFVPRSTPVSGYAMYFKFATKRDANGVRQMYHYNDYMAEIARQWRSMSPQEKQVFNYEAQLHKVGIL